MTIGKTIALSIRDFVGKVTSLFFNVLSRFVIAFLPRSNLLLISWLQSLPTVILEPKKVRDTKQVIEIMFSKVSNENFRVENYNTGKKFTRGSQ